MRLINIYRPPDSSLASFYDDFSDLLERTNSLTSELLITGDFNIHVDTNTSTATKFKETLDIFDLKQHAVIPTHMDGHTLDLIISRDNDQLDIPKPTADTLISDHFSILSRVDFPKTKHVHKTISYRNIRNVNITEFRRDINSSDLIINTATEIQNLVHQYNKCLSELLEKHVPMQMKKLSTKSKVPWFDSKIKKQKVKCRRAERRWLKTRKQVDLDNFKSSRNFLYRTINES